MEAVDRALPEPSTAPVDREPVRGRVRAAPEIGARLVERYLDVTRWPTSKKTALTLSIALPAHLVLSTFAVYEARQFGDGLDTARLAAFLASWCGALAVLLVGSLVLAWMGREGRWTVYALILVYGAFLVRLVMMFGTMSSGLFAASPLVVVFINVFFDRRAGLVAFLYCILLNTAVAVLDLLGITPYADILRVRSLDQMTEPHYYVAVFACLQAFFLYTFLLTRLSVGSREAQQRKLEAAHRQLGETADQLTRANDIISRYVARQLAEQIRAGNYQAIERHDRRKLTLFFSDIQDFSEFADRAEPEDLSSVLNEYLSEMAVIAERYGGTIDKFVGDAVIVFFGAPVATNDRDQALRAVRMALEMQERVAALREKWIAEGFDHPFHIRIGINTGHASVGNFGSHGRMDYTAIGRQVNLAARLEAKCEPDRVLISHATWVLVHDEIPCVPKGDVLVKGIQAPIRVYEVGTMGAGAPAA